MDLFLHTLFSCFESGDLAPFLPLSHWGINVSSLTLETTADKGIEIFRIDDVAV